MPLAITTTLRPATDLGYLLHKSPFHAHSFDLPFGTAQVTFPEASEERCTALLSLAVDPARQGEVASSFLSVAIARAFGTALSGRSKERPELAAATLPLELQLTGVACAEGAPFIERLFAPLGYSVSVVALPDAADPAAPARSFDVALKTSQRLGVALSQLYLLIAVLDDEKHYWVGPEEVKKLLRHGQGWLASHPERDLIVRRYLKHQRDLTYHAMVRLRPAAPTPG